VDASEDAVACAAARDAATADAVPAADPAEERSPLAAATAAAFARESAPADEAAFCDEVGGGGVGRGIPITDTQPISWLVTYAVFPSGVIATPHGFLMAMMILVTVPVAVSILDTECDS